MSRLKNLLRNINYLSKHSLWDQREEDIVYLTNKILDDGQYEYALDLCGNEKIEILDQQESLTMLETHPKSFVRTGDGEIKLMMGQNQPFQKYEAEIVNTLIRLLETPRDDMYVGINRNYYIPLSCMENVEYYRRNAYDFRCFYKEHLNSHMQYLDATFISYPLGHPRCKEYDTIFARWKNLFAGKKLIIACGQGILDSFSYDIFELAESKKIIDAPRINAWDKRESIVQQIKANSPTDCLVLFILGMAGKALIPVLTEAGYMCWDVGHLAKYYNAYMSQMEGTQEAIRNFYAPD